MYSIAKGKLAGWVVVNPAGQTVDGPFSTQDGAAQVAARHNARHPEAHEIINGQYDKELCKTELPPLG